MCMYRSDDNWNKIEIFSASKMQKKRSPKYVCSWISAKMLWLNRLFADAVEVRKALKTQTWRHDFFLVFSLTLVVLFTSAAYQNYFEFEYIYIVFFSFSDGFLLFECLYFVRAPLNLSAILRCHREINKKQKQKIRRAKHEMLMINFIWVCAIDTFLCAQKYQMLNCKRGYRPPIITFTRAGRKNQRTNIVHIQLRNTENHNAE